LRAFLPLFVLGVAAYFGLVDLGEHFEWLGSTPAVLALGVGVLLELMADKIPLVNHLLDALATPARTIAGMLVFGAAVVDLPAWVVAILAIIIGGGVALAVHVAKSGVRAGSSAVTAGASTPVHSMLEDVLCFFSTVLSIAFVGIALIVAAAALFLFWLSARAVLDRVRGSKSAA
jgi:hypothetical protein